MSYNHCYLRFQGFWGTSFTMLQTAKHKLHWLTSLIATLRHLPKGQSCNFNYLGYNVEYSQPTDTFYKTSQILWMIQATEMHKSYEYYGQSFFRDLYIMKELTFSKKTCNIYIYICYYKADLTSLILNWEGTHWTSITKNRD